MNNESLTPAAKQLRAHLGGRLIRQAAFARAVGVSQAHVSKLLSGQSRPSFETAALIQIETGGAVTLDMWARKPAKGRGGADARA